MSWQWRYICLVTLDSAGVVRREQSNASRKLEAMRTCKIHTRTTTTTTITVGTTRQGTYILPSRGRQKIALSLSFIHFAHDVLCMCATGRIRNTDTAAIAPSKTGVTGNWQPAELATAFVQHDKDMTAWRGAQKNCAFCNGFNALAKNFARIDV